MKIPRQTKYRKSHRKLTFCTARQNNMHHLHFGSFGIKALESGRLSSNNIEALRRTLTRRFKRTGKIWIRVFAHTSVTSKPAEVRMGKGKGNPKFWISLIPAGQILFEFSGISINLAKQATALVSRKIGLKVAFTSE
jgi:large subunit ribosomal protein L16